MPILFEFGKIKTIFFADGKFGAYMQVNIQNDGPVTIQLESPVAEPNTPAAVAEASPMKKVTPTSNRQVSMSARTMGGGGVREGKTHLEFSAFEPKTPSTVVEASSMKKVTRTFNRKVSILARTRRGEGRGPM